VTEIPLLILKLNITDAGISFALLLYARATAALLLMFSFAMSTPVPHMARALRRLRLPDVFVEMTVLIYRYTFLLMETAERMHLAAECKFGYSGYRRSMRTTARLTVGVFLRSMDTAERGQITLQCRNYRGEFRSLSEYEKKSKMPTVLCAVIVCIAITFFFALRFGVLPI
jgi:energy-coupling factor transporter transmembrane protein EcfT